MRKWWLWKQNVTKNPSPISLGLGRYGGFSSIGASVLLVCEHRSEENQS